jgi:hypothetical protein
LGASGRNLTQADLKEAYTGQAADHQDRVARDNARPIAKTGAWIERMPQGHLTALEIIEELSLSGRLYINFVTVFFDMA